MKFSTKCVHGSGRPDETGAITPAIYISSTFSHPGLGETTGFQYTRESNPTRDRVERLMTELEEGTDTVAFVTGMAAIAAVMDIFRPGDHILTGDDLYGGSFRLFREVCTKAGLTFDALDTSDTGALKAAIRPETRGLIIETPTNPMMAVTDLKATAEICKANGVLLIVDNTFLSPYFQKPLTLGADIVVHSGTKYLGGHNDVLSGFATTNNPDIGEKLRMTAKTTGGTLPPFDSWLMMRGIKTLPLRMERHQANAKAVAEWLKTQPRVKRVLYPGLPEHPGYEISKAQTSGFGGMISFEVDSASTAKQLLEGIRLVQFAESLGGTESLLTYPLTQTHASLSPEELERKGITDRLLRFSSGIEDAEDIIADFAQAFAAIAD